MAQLTDEPELYQCAADDDRDVCPPSEVVAATPGLTDLISQYQAQQSFKALAWACLMTGPDQRSCLRDVSVNSPAQQASESSSSTSTSSSDSSTTSVTSTTSDPTPDGGSSDNWPVADAGTGNPGSTDGGLVEPTPPGDCTPGSWQPYFAKLATYAYQKKGINITFPVSAFDYTHPALNSGGGLHSNPGMPSCHPGESYMRGQAWLMSVNHACGLFLFQPILTWCNQGSRYAPMVGTCQQTGAW